MKAGILIMLFLTIGHFQSLSYAASLLTDQEVKDFTGKHYSLVKLITELQCKQSIATGISPNLEELIHFSGFSLKKEDSNRTRLKLEAEGESYSVIFLSDHLGMKATITTPDHSIFRVYPAIEGESCGTDRIDHIKSDPTSNKQIKTEILSNHFGHYIELNYIPDPEENYTLCPSQTALKGEQMEVEKFQTAIQQVMQATSKTQSQKRFESWLDRTRGNFLSHAVKDENVEALVQSKVIKPAELVLRENGKVSCEKNKDNSHMRLSYHFPKDEILAKLPPDLEQPPHCEGIFYLKIREAGGDMPHQKIILRRFPGQENWEEIRKIGANPPYGTTHHDLLRYQNISAQVDSDRRLLELLSDKQGKPLDIPYPLPLCYSDLSGDEKNSDFKAKKIFDHSQLVPHYYLDNSQFRDRMQKVSDWAKKNGYSTLQVLLALDERNQRKTQEGYRRFWNSYPQAIAAFLSKKMSLKKSISQENRRLYQKEHQWYMAMAEGTLAHQRNRYFGIEGYAGDLQSDISTASNGIKSEYGRVVILIGAQGISRRHSQGAEVRTPAITCIEAVNGFETISLSDENILLLGPRSILQKYSSDPTLRIVYMEDLTNDQLKKLNIH